MKKMKRRFVNEVFGTKKMRLNTDQCERILVGKHSPRSAESIKTVVQKVMNILYLYIKGFDVIFE